MVMTYQEKDALLVKAVEEQLPYDISHPALAGADFEVSRYQHDNAYAESLGLESDLDDKEEVEAEIGFNAVFANVEAAIKEGATFVWPEGV